MESAHTNSYAPPVDQLLTYGEGQSVSPDDWPAYLELGLGPEQIPDLIRLATDEELIWDDSDRLEVWAPLHAWRALGQLRAEAAIEPLLSLFEPLVENDWAMEELPGVLGMIGPEAFPALAAYMADLSYDEDARISAISSVEKIGTRWPEAHPACVALLMKQLELFTENEPEVNGFLILALVELQATEAAPLMERAFAAKRVDPIVMGEWEDVQVEWLCCKNDGALVNSALFREHQRSSLHEQSEPVQMASFRSRDHLALRALVLAVLAQLSRLGRDDAGAGTLGRS